MALTGTTNEEKIWNYLKGKGLNSYGTAGLMGNLYAESALNPQNIQNSYEKSLGYTDAAYTAAVDSGTYHNFVRDAAGYGLAQWTYWSRKEALLSYVKGLGASVGDLEAQLGFLFKELSEGYASSVLAVLKSATSVRQASDVVLTKYERPADQSERAKEKRASYGQTYYDKYAKTKTNTPQGGSNMSQRQKFVNTAVSFIGCKEADGSHRQIIDIYNGHKPLARGYAVKYTDAWCATFVSAMAIKCGLTDIIPTECGCGQMIQLFQKIGAWQENDAYTPQPGDVIFYDWDDSGAGDNTGWPDHVGIVEAVSGSSIKVIEGNMSDAVGRRTIKVNGRYIRGYGVPKFVGSSSGSSNTGNKPTTPGNTSAKPAEGLCFKVGDVVQFTGTKHHTSSYTGATAKTCKSGKAKVTAINKTGAHPYHVVAVSGGGSNVYGWVDAADLAAANLNIAVGDVVQFAGGPHYASANATSYNTSPKAGPAKVTAISKNAKHPYHVIHTTSASTVYGWVDADKVTK